MGHINLTHMKKSACALLPYDPVPKAVAMTYAEVFKKGSEFRGETPYANAFCRMFFGKSRPCKANLLTISVTSSDTVPKIMRNLDRFLRSNGEANYLVSSYFAEKAFPSKAINRETRISSRIDMSLQRNSNIKTKAEAIHMQKLECKKKEMVSLERKELPAWVSDNEETLSEFELQACLRHWYAKNDISDWRFSDLYSEMSASRIALDLSFND